MKCPIGFFIRNLPSRGSRVSCRFFFSRMKKLSYRFVATFIVFAAPLLLPVAAQAQGWDWATATTPARTSRGGRAVAVALDGAGNTLVTGIFRDSLQCGATQLISEGGADLFIGKLDPTGQWLWVVQAGGVSSDSVSGIAATPSGGVVITGTTLANTLIGPALVAGAAGRTNMFVAQLSATGQWQWVTAPQPTNSWLGLQSGALATDAAGTIWVSGAPSSGGGTAMFGADSLAMDLMFRRDFIGCLSSTGQWQWVGQPTTWTSTASFTHLAVDAAHDALYVGGAWGEADPICPMGFGVPHAFAGRVSATAGGAWQWVQADTARSYSSVTDSTGSHPIYTGSASSISALATDGAGRVFATGWYGGQAALGGAPFGPAPDNAQPFFTVALDAATGAGHWTRRIWATGAVASPNGLTVTPAGDVTLVGNADFLPGPPCGTTHGGAAPPPLPDEGMIRFGDSTAVAAGYGAGFVARLMGATGVCEWAIRADAYLWAVAADVLGNTVVTGDYNEMATFGPSTLPWSASSSRVPMVAAISESAPLVRSLSAYTAAPGTVLTLTGANFTGATQVLLGGIPAVFTVVNATTILVTVPVGPIGGVVTVVGPQGVGRGASFASLPLGLTANGQLTGQLTLWPNPATDVVRLTVGDAPTKVELLDAVGRVVRRVPVATGTLTLPVADLPAGTYTVRAGARVARLVRQ